MIIPLPEEKVLSVFPNSNILFAWLLPDISFALRIVSGHPDLHSPESICNSRGSKWTVCANHKYASSLWTFRDHTVTLSRKHWIQKTLEMSRTFRHFHFWPDTHDQMSLVTFQVKKGPRLVKTFLNVFLHTFLVPFHKSALRPLLTHRPERAICS